MARQLLKPVGLPARCEFSSRKSEADQQRLLVLTKREMKFSTEQSRGEIAALAQSRGRRARAGFTLIETMIVTLLVAIMVATSMGALLSMSLCANRSADYVAASAIVQAKLEDIRGATYNPPNAPFNSYTTNRTYSDSVSLDKAGVNFKVAGTLTARFEPVSGGHLVTVTGTFTEPRKTLTVTMQTLVNKYSGGQQ
jgi:prepilin-type N-terminal cleavage/methylation domain-containing protein